MAQIAINDTTSGQVEIDGLPVGDILKAYLTRQKRRISPFDFEAELYPERPGCYLMKDREGAVIYVGKAKNLRNRLSSYFKTHLDWKKTELLVGEVCEIEIIIVNNESESLFLENNLIKYYRPKFNRALMREDTGFAYIVLTEEEIPRLALYRKKRVNKGLKGVDDDRSLQRYGPYLNAQLILDIATENFKLRTCHPLGKQVCLSYHIAKCSGICEGVISKEEYQEVVVQARKFLSYRPDEQIAEMTEKMMGYADRLEFERAAKLKKQIRSLEITLQKQIVERDIEYDQDVLYFGEEHLLVTQIEQGMIRGMWMVSLPLRSEDRSLPWKTIVSELYPKRCPKELIVNDIPDIEKLEQVLGELGYKAKVTVPKRGLKAQLLQLCEENYRYRIKGQVQG